MRLLNKIWSAKKFSGRARWYFRFALFLVGVILGHLAGFGFRALVPMILWDVCFALLSPLLSLNHAIHLGLAWLSHTPLESLHGYGDHPGEFLQYNALVFAAFLLAATALWMHEHRDDKVGTVVIFVALPLYGVVVSQWPVYYGG